MSAIADQTARPNGLKFFEGFVEYPWGNNRLKNGNFFLSKIPRATPALQLVLYDKLAHIYYLYIC